MNAGVFVDTSDVASMRICIGQSLSGDLWADEHSGMVQLLHRQRFSLT